MVCWESDAFMEKYIREREVESFTVGVSTNNIQVHQEYETEEDQYQNQNVPTFEGDTKPLLGFLTLLTMYQNKYLILWMQYVVYDKVHEIIEYGGWGPNNFEA